MDASTEKSRSGITVTVLDCTELTRANGGEHHRTPVPLQRWHFTTLSPFLSKPLPSQFLHFCFFLMFGPFSLTMKSSCRERAVD
jgi:hypothetical protein